MKKSSEAGWSLIEMSVVFVILFGMLALSVPTLRAYSVESHIVGSGRIFKSEFLRARSMAIASRGNTAIRFEPCDGEICYSVYRDLDRDGVLSADIKSQKDARLSGPFSLSSRAAGVRVGINPGVPSIPPESGDLEGDPIRFGRSRMISFSPLGSATPGTFYLAGEGVQAAVRVNGGSSRVRLMIWNGGTWSER